MTSKKHKRWWCSAVKHILTVCVLLIALPAGLVAAVQNEQQSAPGKPSTESSGKATSLLSKANAAYTKGQFHEAVQAYQDLLGMGYGAADLFYNLGNAYYRLDAIPSAILYYEKARKLSPGDEDIEVNLRFANQKIRDKIKTVPEFFLAQWWKGVMTALSLQAWSVITVTLFTAGFALLILYLFTSANIQRATFYSGIVVLVVASFSLLITAKLDRYLETNQHGIIFNGTAHVKSAPGSRQKTIFVIHEGLKVSIGEEENGWVEITLPNGAVGWIEASAIREI